jgi:para-nitrobenzyl esterase
MTTPLSRAILLMAALLGASAARAEPVRASLDSGVIVGDQTGDVSVFKGIPYTAPPVGPLRWAPPKPVAPWTGDRKADAFGAVCPQAAGAQGKTNLGGVKAPGSEDCLFLNVWAPKGAIHAPVMVWLHGGANIAGAGSLGAYDGSAFARDGVILVTLNYRLGVLGFFAHPALTAAAGPDEPLGSYGLMDQIAALRWVQKNVAAFGGDPANVTLFGESAGGTDTLALLATLSAKGLFARAIVESGAGWDAQPSLARAESAGSVFALRAGAPGKATAEQLRAIPLSRLMAQPAGVIRPIVDGRLMLESTPEAIAYGHYFHLPLVIGSNSYEASLMRTLNISTEAAMAIAPPSVRAAYADLPTDNAKAIAMFTDAFMGAPAHWIAGKDAAGPSWLYHFSYIPERFRGVLPGATHAMEIAFVFDSWDKIGAEGEGLKAGPEDLAMTKVVHSCWVAFAKTGVPTCSGAPAWPAFTKASDTLIDFDTATTLKTDFRAAQYKAQEAVILPRLLGH